MGLRATRLCIGAFALLALATYGFAVYDLVRALLEDGLAPAVIDRDFVNYWLGGRMALSGEHMILFNHDSYFALFEETFGRGYQIRSWSYPPHFLLLIWPLGLVGYKAAFVGFFVATFVLFALAASIFRNRFAPASDRAVLLLATFGYVLMMIVAAQNGFLTAAALLLGLALMKDRPVLAGIAFACLTIKPQLGFLVPLLLLFDRNWRALLWASVFTAVLIGASVVVFGVESWTAYVVDTLAYQRSVMTDWYGIFLRMMPTVFGSMRSLGWPPELAAQVQLPVSIAAAALVLWLLWREQDPLRRAFVVLCGTLLVTPYAFNYDMGALSVCAAVLCGSTRENGERWLIPIAISAVVAGAVTNLGRANFPVTPLILACGLIAVAWRARQVSVTSTRGTPASASR